MCTENDFSGAKVGNRVWDYLYGWGEIINVIHGHNHPIFVIFKSRTASYTLSGFSALDHMRPTLFHDEVKITPPPRPKRKVKKEISIWMSNYPNGDSYFHFSKNEADKKAASNRIDCIELKGEREVEE